MSGWSARSAALAFVLILMAGDCGASGFSGAMLVTRIRVHAEMAYVGTTTQPAGTCSAYGEYFKFDHRTAEGKAYLAMLMTAKASGKEVQIWYDDSTAPGATEADGCNDTTLSRIWGVAMP